MQLPGLNKASNWSFYAVPAAWSVAMAPHFYAIFIVSTAKAPGAPGFDYSNPKRTRERISDSRLSPAHQDRYLRAERANDNSFTCLPFFAAAIVAGNLANLPVRTLNRAAALYLGSRVAFNLLYIFGTNNALGILRTAVWFVSMYAPLSLFVKAGHAFRTVM